MTRRRLNISKNTTTRHEARVRAQFNKLEGFALFAPITVPLAGQLDLATVNAESVFVVELASDAETPIRLIPLDLGDGYFPIRSELRWMIGLPPLKPLPNLMFGADNNPSGLQWRSEAERRAAMRRARFGGGDDINHYDVESDTLIIRLLKPLSPNTRYAVVLGDTLAGWSDEGIYGPLRSPFAGVSALRDRASVTRATRWLERTQGKRARFGWTFTTSDPRRMLDQVREGLYGRGELASLEMEPRITEVRDTDLDIDPDTDLDTDPEGEERSSQLHGALLPASYFERFSGLVAAVTSNEGYAVKFSDVDYFVFGSFSSPNMRVERSWIVQPDAQGKLSLITPPQVDEVPFLISIPKPSVRSQPPFPVAIYFHGTNTSRIEGVILAQELARQGIALLAFDQIGHGPLLRNYRTFNLDNPEYGAIVNSVPLLIARLLAPDLIDEIAGKSFSESMELLSGIGVFRELAVLGRWEDVNGDGYQAEAEGFFDPDPTKLCASFWQDSVDAMAAVKLLRSLRQMDVPPRLGKPSELEPERLRAHLLAGDFNADGVLDLGGPDVQISAAGTSLGGLHALLVGALEPEIEVVTPIAPGAGLIDILSRTGLRFVARPLFESFLGQAVVGCPDQGREMSAEATPERLYISLGDDARRCDLDDLEGSARFTLEGDWRGATVKLTNHETGEHAQASVDARGGFTIGLASDRGDEMTLEVIPTSESSHAPLREPFQARVDGYGHKLHTPEFRRAAYQLHQLLERCDPIAFNQAYRESTGGARPVKTLVSAAIGDQTVPINTAVSLANALDLLGEDETLWRPRLEALRDRGVLLGSPPEIINNAVEDLMTDREFPLYDVDLVTRRDMPPADALGVTPAVRVGDGWSAIRFADVERVHQWIAGYTRDGFNYGLYTQRQVAAYHRCSGRVILDEDPWCLQSESCPLIDELYLRDECQLPSR